jgi:signal transduction histidine kinase
VRNLLRIAIMLMASLPGAGSLAGEPLPRTVLVLDQSIPHTAWFGELFSAFQSTVKTDPSSLITIYSERLDYSRFKGPEYNQLLHAFIKAKYREKPIGVIVAIGRDTLQFAIDVRVDLGSQIPIVFADIDDRARVQLKFPPDVTGTTVLTTLRDAVVSAKALVPDLKRIALVGEPLEQQTYRRHFKQELPIYTRNLELIDLTGLAMPELRKRVAALPEDTAILYTSLSVDGAGTHYDPNDALALVAQVANRPIVVDLETRLGYGGTGGFLLRAAPIGEATAWIALRLLNGESAATIPITIGDFVKPVFDWRQLQRWGINESRLPAGSEIRFRPPTAWEQYRLQIISIAIAVLGQSLLIAGLLYQRRRRQQAELETGQRVAELARMNHRALASEMSTKIAHELSQSLTAILSNAETAHDLLGQKNLDPEKIRKIVSDIIEADARASNMIDRVRKLLWKGESKREKIDLNELVESTMHLANSELVKRWITIETALAADLPATAGDPAQLQQVLLNLLINAMDAVGSKTPPRRIIKISTRANGKHVEVDITDSGHGIAADDHKRVFEPFFTTKDQGLGLGLSICSTIVKAHEGKLSIHNNDFGGATAVLSLPVAAAQTEQLVSPILPPIPLATRDLRKVIANP